MEEDGSGSPMAPHKLDLVGSHPRPLGVSLRLQGPTSQQMPEEGIPALGGSVLAEVEDPIHLQESEKVWRGAGAWLLIGSNGRRSPRIHG